MGKKIDIGVVPHHLRERMNGFRMQDRTLDDMVTQIANMKVGIAERREEVWVELGQHLHLTRKQMRELALIFDIDEGIIRLDLKSTMSIKEKADALQVLKDAGIKIDYDGISEEILAEAGVKTPITVGPCEVPKGQEVSRIIETCDRCVSGPSDIAKPACSKCKAEPGKKPSMFQPRTAMIIPKKKQGKK